MSSQQFERFRMRVRNVTLPENVRESVIDEIRVEKGERVRSSRQGRGAGSPVTRRFIVTAGLGSLGIAAGYLALSVAARPDPAEPAEGVRATEPEGNFFALAAYADGTPYGDSTVIAKQMVGSAGAYGGSPGLYWYAARTLNFDVAGTSIEKISYALEGEVVGFPEGGAEGVPLDRPYAYFDALYNHPDQVEGARPTPTTAAPLTASLWTTPARSGTRMTSTAKSGHTSLRMPSLTSSTARWTPCSKCGMAPMRASSPT